MDESPTPPSSRQSHLDSLRGIAGLVVVLVHYLCAFYPYSIFGVQAQTKYQQFANWEDLLFLPPFGLVVAGNPAVCLFFILSGYVLSYSHLGRPGRKAALVAAIIKRPIRLGGLVWATIILSGLIWYFDGYFNNAVAAISHSKPWFNYPWFSASGTLDTNLFFTDLFTASFSRGFVYNAPLWTVEIELYGSILVYLFLILFANARYRWVFYLALIAYCANSYYQGFWLGILLADLVKNQYIRASSKIWPPLFLFSAATFFACDPHFLTPDFRATNTIYRLLPSDDGLNTGYSMLSAVLLFISVNMSLQMQNWLNKPILQYYGRVSYALYVVHFIVLGSLSSWMFLTLLEYFSYGVTFIVVFVVGVAVITGLAEIGTRYVDDPAIRVSHYIQKKIAGGYKSISKTITGS